MREWRNWAILGLRLFCGVLFIYAAYDKILHPLAFSDTVFNYHLLPRQLVNIFSLWLPWLELVAGIMLVAGIWGRACAALLSGMMLMFLVAIGQAVFRGIDIHCGCFTQNGDATDPVSFLTIARDIAFLIATLLAFRFEKDVPTWRLLARGKSVNALP